jgi:uncharacterized protein DUF6496
LAPHDGFGRGFKVHADAGWSVFGAEREEQMPRPPPEKTHGREEGKENNEEGKEAPLLEEFGSDGRKGNAPLQKGHCEKRARRQGGRVKSKKQAIAIGLSKARKKGKKVAKKKSRR